jgi:hypothetical protein
MAGNIAQLFLQFHFSFVAFFAKNFYSDLDSTEKLCYHEHTKYNCRIEARHSLVPTGRISGSADPVEKGDTAEGISFPERY